MAALPRAPSYGPLFGSGYSDVHESYTIGRKLGTGTFAKVVLAQRKLAGAGLAAGERVAIKVLKKPSSSRSAERLQMLRAEVEILRSIRHPNIVRMYELYESASRLYLVVEFLAGGELFDRIVQLGKYSEEDARYFTFKLLNAVLYLHDRNICHRDLKPENILLDGRGADAELKIADFGLSHITALSHDFMMSMRCGTPGYVAPEVLAQHVNDGQLRRYGTGCDLWSVGVIVYILLCGSPPFHGKTEAEMNRKVLGGSYRFPERYWGKISGSAKDFIARLLQVDPARRMTACEALQHGWMVSIGLHTNDLFADVGGGGVPEMQARLHEFNLERRSTAQAHSEMREMLGLPEEEDELQRFRTSHSGRTGHLVVTPAHLAFLAYDQSKMFSVPISEVVSLRRARLLTHSAASDNSLIAAMSNGVQLQFDGFWERDECAQLLQACARFIKHEITLHDGVDGEGGGGGGGEGAAPASGGAASSDRPAAGAELSGDGEAEGFEAARAAGRALARAAVARGILLAE